MADSPSAAETSASFHGSQDEQPRDGPKLHKGKDRVPGSTCTTHTRPLTAPRQGKMSQNPSQAGKSDNKRPKILFTPPVLLPKPVSQVINPNDGPRIRFAAPSRNQSYAHPRTNLCSNTNQTFAPLRTKQVVFVDSDYEESNAKKKHKSEGCSRKTTFNIARPVKNSGSIHLDAWRLIFDHSDLRFLQEAKTVCKSFYNVLKDEQIWRRCRLNQFGTGCPAPPADLTEQQFAALLVGKGCQQRSCARMRSSKVYWAFRLRLCLDCLKRSTIRENGLGEEIKFNCHGFRIVDLLESAIWHRGKYQTCRRFDATKKDWVPFQSHLLFLKKDIADFQSAWTQIQRESTDESTIQEWRSHQLQKVGKLALEAANIEEWEKSQLSSPNNFPTDRYNFFIQKAAELQPPLAAQVLNKFPAFQRALLAKQSDELAWANLISMIIPYRSQAEALTWGDPKWPLPETFIQLHYHRSGRRHYSRFQPEQEFVLQLARDALEHCLTIAIPDSLLVMACLQSVYKRYTSLPISDRPSGLNYDGTTGPYILSLDDARMIIEEVMNPYVHHNSPRYALMFSQFKCTGCQRKDWAKSLTFVAGFEHIHHQHAQSIEPGLRHHELFRHFPRVIQNQNYYFPWYTVAWPRCLPLVPHSFALQQGARWDPDAEFDFCLPQPPQKSVFDSRLFFSYPELEAHDFAGNLKFACSIMDQTSLSSLYQIKLALCYARDRYASAAESEVTLEVIILALRNAQKSNSKIELRFRCGICVHDEQVNRGSNLVKHPGELNALMSHWRIRHSGAKCAAIEMIDLPDDFETMREVMKADEALRELKLSVRTREAKRLTNPRMRIMPKADVIMRMGYGMDAVDLLFPKIETMP